MDEWEKYTAAPSSGDEWEEYAAPVGKQTSTAEALGSGALQGLSLGFADEAIGAVKGALDPKKTVQEGIEEQRKRKELIEQEHPIASTVGDVGGSLIPAAVSIAGTVASGGAAAPTIAPTAGKAAAGIGKLAAKFGLRKAAKEGAEAAVKAGLKEGAEQVGGTALKKVVEKVPGKTLEAAATGAAAGVGYSDAIASDDPEAAMRALASAGMGAGLGVAANKILPAAGKAIKGVKGKLGRQLISGVTEVDEEAIRYMQNPALRAKLNTTKTMPVIGEEVISKLDDMVNKTRAQSGEGFKILEASTKMESPYQVESIYNKNIDALKAKNQGGTYDAAIKSLEEMRDRVMSTYEISDKAAKSIPADRIKNLIWEVEDRIPDNYATLTKADKIVAEPFVQIRKDLNTMLRNNSKDYADLMDKVSSQVEFLKNFRKQYGSNPDSIGRAIGEHMKAERLGRDKTKKQQLFDILKEDPDGAQIYEEAKAVWARDQFNKAVGKGSTNTNVGIMLGGSVIGSALMAGGVPPPVAIAIGGAVGGVFGKIWNSYGTRMTRYILETYIEQAEKKEAAKVPGIVKKPLEEFTKAMAAIPEPMQRYAVVNALLQHQSMKQDEMKAPSERAIKYGFERVAK